MKKVVVPVDGSKPSINAVKHVVELYHQSKSLTVFLINIQMPLHLIHPKIINKDMLKDYYYEEGVKALKQAEEMLQKANVKYTKKIMVGSPAEEIVEFAKKEKCDGIIMGARGVGKISNLVLGSTSSKVIHLTDIPVTIIK